MRNLSLRSWIVAGGAILLVALIGWWLLGRQPGDAPAQEQTQPPATRPQATAALPALAGRVLQSGCRQMECAWLRVVRLESVAVSPHGELRRLTARRGRSTYRDDPPEAYSEAVPVQWDAADRDGYAFCSTERPAYAFADETGSLILHYLDLFDLAGYQYASAAMYMRICHDLDFPYDNSAPLAALGYRPGTRNEQVENAEPGDLARF